jgi:hypothetical protein
MGSTAPDTFGSQQEHQAYPVKAEYNVYEDQHQLQSSEEEYSGVGEHQCLSQAGDGERNSASDTHLSFGDSFGQSIAPATSSSSTVSVVKHYIHLAPTSDELFVNFRCLGLTDAHQGSHSDQCQF